MRLTADLTGRFMSPVCDTTMLLSWSIVWQCLIRRIDPASSWSTFYCGWQCAVRNFLVYCMAMGHMMDPSCIFMEYILLRMAMRRTEFKDWSKWINASYGLNTVSARVRDDAQFGSLQGSRIMFIPPWTRSRTSRNGPQPNSGPETYPIPPSFLNQTILDRIDRQCRHLSCSAAVRPCSNTKRLGIFSRCLNGGSLFV